MGVSRETPAVPPEGPSTWHMEQERVFRGQGRTPRRRDTRPCGHGGGHPEEGHQGGPRSPLPVSAPSCQNRKVVGPIQPRAGTGVKKRLTPRPEDPAAHCLHPLARGAPHLCGGNSKGQGEEVSRETQPAPGQSIPPQRRQLHGKVALRPAKRQPQKLVPSRDDMTRGQPTKRDEEVIVPCGSGTPEQPGPTGRTPGKNVEHQARHRLGDLRL